MVNLYQENQTTIHISLAMVQGQYLTLYCTRLISDIAIGKLDNGTDYDRLTRKRKVLFKLICYTFGLY